MATPNVGILTTTGKALIDKVNSGQAKISFSKVVFSSMDNSQLSDTQIKALTAIAPQEVVVSSPEATLDTNSGETRIRATGTNEKLADGVYVKTYGVFAKDDTGNEILYGVTVSPNPNYFPAYDGVTPQAVTYSYKTVIQETSNITMTNSNDVYVSQEDLTEAIAKIPQPDLSGYDKTDDVDKKLQNKQDKLGFTAANDSTVVHTADMRKPAGDVVGLEDITQTALPDGTDFYTLLNTAGRPLQYFVDTFVHAQTMLNKPKSALSAFILITSAVNNSIATTYNYTFLNLRDVSTGDSYEALINTDGTGKVTVVRPWHKIADDSKVAHLSGANNFDTVPTVNNNPLLLASSLPSDLARTSQQTNFTDGLQKGGKDVATVDDVSAKQDKLDYTPANDANVVHRNPDTGSVSEPVDFTKLTVNGGKSVATSDDLKSVADSAWYIIPENNNNTIRDIGWMKRDPVNHYLYILYNFATVPWVPTSEMLVDLSSYVDALDDARGYIMLSSNECYSNDNVWYLRDSHRAMSTVWAKGATLVAGSRFDFSDPDGGKNYLKLTTFNDNVDNNPWTNKCLRVHYNNWIRS